MTIKISESFQLIADAAGLSKRAWAFAEGSVVAAAGPFGLQCWSFGSHADALTVALESPLTTPYVGISCWRKFHTPPTANTWILQVNNATVTGSVPSSSSAHGGLRGAGNTDITVFRGNGAIVTTLSNALTLGAWQHFEWRHYIHNTVGTIELWIDGIHQPDADVLGDASDSGSVTSVGFNGNVDGATSFIADVIIAQHATQPVERTGVARIHTLLPDGDSANTAWTGGFANVDDPLGASDGAATVVSSNVLNAKQDYTFADLPETPSSVLAVVVETEASKDVVGTVGMTPYVNSNTVEAAGAEATLATAFGHASSIFVTNPDGGAAWTPAAVNAVIAGHEITTL